MTEAATRRPFEIDDLFRFEFVTEACLSPDGARVVYVVQRCDVARDTEPSSLWLLDLADGQAVRLTHGDWADYGPVWRPDGRALTFLSTRAGKPQIYELPLGGGEAVRLAGLPQGCAGPLLWSPDGRHLLFHAGPPEPPDPTKPYRVTRAVHRFDGAGNVDGFIKSLQLFSTADGALRPLTTGGCNHQAVGWSADSQRLLVLASFDPTGVQHNAHLQIVDLAGQARTVLAHDWGVIFNAAWCPDGRIAFLGLPAGLKPGTKTDLFVIDTDGRNLEVRTASQTNVLAGRLHDDLPVAWSLSAPPILIEPGTNDAIVNLQEGGAAGLIAVALSGPEHVKRLAGGPRFCFPFQRVGQRLVFGVGSMGDPTQLALLDLETGAERQLTQLNRELRAAIAWPEARAFTVPGADGVPVEGWVMTPPGAGPFPTVLHIHGGPHAAYGHVFSFDFQTLVGAGFAVVFINQRGSTGYGSAFATAIHGDWGNLDYHDLMAGLDHVIALGIADPARLGCCGVSGGGYLSCWIVGQTNRFKAAAPENPVTNFVSFYGTADMGASFAVRELGGRPQEIPDVYARCSPLTYAQGVTTPTLLIIGEQDHRCPPEQAEQFYTALKANGCVVEMLRFPGSSHDGATLGSFAVRRAHNEALVAWMKRWL